MYKISSAWFWRYKRFLSVNLGRVELNMKGMFVLVKLDDRLYRQSRQSSTIRKIYIPDYILQSNSLRIDRKINLFEN